MQALSPNQLKALLDADNSAKPLIIDVREPWEIATASLTDVTCIPMAEIPSRLHDLDPAKTTVVICHHGMRSLQVANYLASRGFSDVFNLDGGIDAWSREVDPSIPRY